MTAPFLSGFALSFSLILAIGAQNAFVLRQGLRRAHVLPVVLVCAVSDAILISAGVAGFGALVELYPGLPTLLRYAGAAFLVVYGALAARSAWTGTGALKAAERAEGSVWAAVLTCLALTWLNPHVYLDTLALLGSIAQTSPAPAVFGAGAVTASFVFFFSLGFGARALAPLFARPGAWRVLDAGIALLMWAIAAGLVLGA